MARRNISLPDELDERARRARLNVSALARRALTEELDRQSRMARLDAWLDELDSTHGAPSAAAMAEAEAWWASAKHVEHRSAMPRAPRTRARPTTKRAAG